jgi:gamma-glutamyl-gamma-aminobutyraldehyde dehydrogenase
LIGFTINEINFSQQGKFMQQLDINYFQSISNKLSYPTQAFVNGQFVDAISKKTFETINPARKVLLAKVASCDKEDLELAVSHAKLAFDQGSWSKMAPSSRKAIMQQWANLIKAHAHELAVLESLDSGKPITDCLNGDVEETKACLAWYGEAIDKLYDQIAPSGSEVQSLIVREPVGVVGAVLPWNFPMLMMAWKIGPALAAGNSVIVKPAEQTSLTALFLAKLANEAGIPAGVLNILPGFGEIIGQAIGLHPDIQVVSFTGSTEVGRQFLTYSAQSNLKRIVLECGGKSPSVVLKDAENLDKVAEQVLQAVFWNMGENCTSNSRLIVHKEVKQALVNKLLVKAKDWQIGNPLDPNMQLGAMISGEHFDKVMAYIEHGKQEGATLLLGGDAINTNDGYFIPPVIFDDVSSSMRIAKEEIFGPVLAIMTVDSDDEAISLANEIDFGLQASLYTSHINKAIKGAKAIKAGTVSVNCFSEGDITTPFGGYKLSGFGGRDNGLHAFEQYMETKTIWIEL